MQAHEDAMSDYLLTAGAIIDAMSSGVPLGRIEEVFYSSASAIEFERAIWKVRDDMQCLLPSA